MTPTAVEQARARLARAESALKSFDEATVAVEAEVAWTDFLLAAGSVYSKLEQGAKADGKSVAWFGRKKNERKKDPLLRYLHFARNSEEHGIERIAEMTPPNFSLDGRKLKFNERIPVKAQLGDKEPMPTFSGPIFDAVIAGPTLKPVRANDRRFNDFCDPPTEHLGQLIPNSSFVADLGKAAIPYLRQMVSEAESLAHPDPR
jgi:hypothetical protein